MGPVYFARPMVGPCSPVATAFRQQALANRAFRQSSPRYEITDNDERFQVAVDVPGVKMEDINVSLEEDGKILTISGQRESTNERYSFTSRFAQSFTLDSAVDTEKITANLKNGVLIIAAPKNMALIEQAIRKIPITQLDDIAGQPVAVADGTVDIKLDEDKNDNDDKPTVEA
jgi:HSP20 family protein